MNMSIEVLEAMGESADGSISYWAWGPAMLNAAKQIKELQAALSTAEADRKALADKVRRIGVAARRQSLNEAASADYFRGAMQSIADSCGDAIGEFIDIPATKSQLLSDGLRSEAEGKGNP